MEVKLGIVSETNAKFINQVKLLIYSLRENGGLYKDIPVVLITNDKPIKKEDRDFLEEKWIAEYAESEVFGKSFLAKTVREYKKKYCEND